MRNKKIFLFDFDGVIVNGMQEYWCSSLLACKKFLHSRETFNHLDTEINIFSTFKDLRPWVKYGWEMVLITHELIKLKNPLNQETKDLFLRNYNKNCIEILKQNSWDAHRLQKALDDAREYQMSDDLDKWIKLHEPFMPVVKSMEIMKEKGCQIGIISTKGSKFTKRILQSFNIFPERIFGYESGTKIEIITQLKKEFNILGFIEDRLKTLNQLIIDPRTNEIPYYLADWGYLKKSDRIEFHKDINLIKFKDLEDIVANLN